MDFINVLAELFGFEVTNNILTMYNYINNNQRNIVYRDITNQIENVTDANQYSSINYLVYLIISTLTYNNHHTYSQFLDSFRDKTVNSSMIKLVEEEFVKYLTQGQIKLIMLQLYSNINENNSVINNIINILDVLSNEQLFIIMNINGDINNNNGNSLVSNIVQNSHNFYMVADINGNDYYNLHFEFENNNNKDDEIRHLENVYNDNDMNTYFHFAINKLFNSDCGIRILNRNIGMTHHQLSFCLYYCNHPTMTISERFHKFINVLSLEQLVYIGV
jgi:hypothetical protein